MNTTDSMRIALCFAVLALLLTSFAPAPVPGQPADYTLTEQHLADLGLLPLTPAITSAPLYEPEADLASYAHPHDCRCKSCPRDCEQSGCRCHGTCRGGCGHSGGGHEHQVDRWYPGKRLVRAWQNRPRFFGRR